jgi:hypothetical protein
MGMAYATASAYQSAQGTKPNYVTGAANLPPANCNQPFNPYTMVINLKTGRVMAKDQSGNYVETNEIISLVQQANQ